MKILILGSGAREHAIVTALARESVDGSPAHAITVAPGNDGMGEGIETVRFNPSAPEVTTEFAVQEGFDLVVIGPEAPLVAGVGDALRRAGVPVFGPTKKAAAIEGSKSFAKRIMEGAGVPTGRAEFVETLDEVAARLDEYGAPYVVKADGLAAGKGVLVTSDREAALQHAEYWLNHGAVLVEEFLEGPEVSLFFFADGKTVRPLAPAQDFKRLHNNDEGPNTGGMGAYSPLPFLAERFGSEAAFVDEIQRTVAQPTIDQLAAEGIPFEGLLYCGLVVTQAGPRVIEFNARFGDPETQVVLARMTSPLSSYLLASATGTLDRLPAPEFTDAAGVTIVLASEGYPDAVQSGREVTGIDEAERVHGVHVLHAATALDTSHEKPATMATGGRVLTVVALGTTIAAARDAAYEALRAIHLEGGQYRTDIAETAARAEEAAA